MQSYTSSSSSAGSSSPYQESCNLRESTGYKHTGGKPMKKQLIILTALILAACTSQPAAPTIDANAIAETAAAAVWFSITQTAQALPTLTPTPAFTATPSNTPAPTDTPAPTADPLYSEKTDGFYLVNVDIAPGVWRSTGTEDGCYWAVTSASGDILANHFGQAGGTAYIDPTGFQVEFNDCGTWVFIQGP